MKLAVIGRVSETRPIDGADRIHQAFADCGDEGIWSGVVAKEIDQGDVVAVLLQDAILPESSRWDFMSKHKWRVRMARFKGVPSECVIVPAMGSEELMPNGYDLTEELGVKKYEKPVPAAIAGDVRGNFPSFIPKTDEENFQRIRHLDSLMDGWDWVASMKYDGTSCTAWVDENNELHVCSRNLELKEFTATGAGNVYWQAARKFGLEAMPPGMALQFEVCGPGVQGNPCGFDEIEIFAFTLHNIADRERCHFGTLTHFCQHLGIPMAQIIASGHGPVSHERLRSLADSAIYPNGKQGEGIVVRSINSMWSFKAISLQYKD
jgi:RNA ligase (TIGR02306 family)